MHRAPLILLVLWVTWVFWAIYMLEAFTGLSHKATSEILATCQEWSVECIDKLLSSIR